MLGWVIEINMITIDIETRSDKDISKCGVYAYTDTPYFDILLFAYSIDGQPVQVVDTANGEEIPENVLAALAYWLKTRTKGELKFYWTPFLIIAAIYASSFRMF